MAEKKKRSKEEKLEHLIRRGAKEGRITPELIADTKIVMEGTTGWRRKRLYWTLQERIAYDLIAFVIICAVLFGLFHFVIGASFVKGNSMYPTLHNHEVACYTRIYSDYQKGDVISIRMPSGEFFVKRIIALPGDTVDIRDGQVYVNDELLEEDYAFGATELEEGNETYPLTIEDGQIYVLGDNREHSKDSRSFGPIINEQVKGKIWFYIGKLS